MPQPFVIAAFRAFPSPPVVVLFRGHQLPCRYPPTCCDARTPTLSPATSSDAHARERSGRVPSPTRGPLLAGRSPPPGRPGSRPAEPSRSASFTDFEAFLPLSSPFAPRRVAPAQRSLLSWPSAPPEFVLQASEPRTRPASRAEHRTDRRAEARDPCARRRGPQPPSPGGTFTSIENGRVSSLGSIRSPSGPRRTASRRQLLLP